MIKENAKLVEAFKEINDMKIVPDSDALQTVVIEAVASQVCGPMQLKIWEFLRTSLRTPQMMNLKFWEIEINVSDPEIFINFCLF